MVDGGMLNAAGNVEHGGACDQRAPKMTLYDTQDWQDTTTYPRVSTP